MANSARSVLRTPCRGMLLSRPTVYGCFGLSNTSVAVPCSMTTPAYITPTRSHMLRMTPRLWAINRTAAFVSSRSVLMRPSTSASTVASRPVVGSSSTSSLGSDANAMAMTTRCNMPPDSWCGKRSSTLPGSAILTRTSASRALFIGLGLALTEQFISFGDLSTYSQRRVHRSYGVLVDHRHFVRPHRP